MPVEKWNPLIGCTPVSSVCDHCRAVNIISSHTQKTWTEYSGWLASQGEWSKEVRLLHERLEQPLHWRNPRHVKVCTYGDLFNNLVPDIYIAAIFYVMSQTPQHIYWILTQRLGRAATWFNWVNRTDPIAKIGNCAKEYDIPGSDQQVFNFGWPLKNVRIGSIANSQKMFNSACKKLVRLPAEYIYMRLQLAEYIDISNYKLNGLIYGGETGKDARPMHPAWARSIQEQCATLKIPSRFKGFGEWSPRGPGSSDFEICSVSGDSLGEHPVWMGRCGKKLSAKLLDGKE